VARSFVAEEQVHLLLSVDPRASMHLPEALPKFQVARWLVEALGSVAHQSGDQVVLHWLFDPASSAPVPLHHTGQLERTLAKPPVVGDATPPNLRHLQPFLPPTAVWLVLSDGYFDLATAGSLAATISAAQAKMCWVLWLELDSWPYERARLGEDVWRVARPDGEELPSLVQMTDENIEQVGQRIRTHLLEFLTLTRLSVDDQLRWEWPAQPAFDRETFFQYVFLNDERIRSIFVKQQL
jgi:hypothetical protein